MQCPRCSSEVPNKATKEWSFKNSYYIVKKYPCPKCKKSIFEYYHDDKLRFTIPSKNGKKNKWLFENSENVRELSES
jgi:cytidine deaminase